MRRTTLPSALLLGMCEGIRVAPSRVRGIGCHSEEFDSLLYSSLFGAFIVGSVLIREVLCLARHRGTGCVTIADGTWRAIGPLTVNTLNRNQVLSSHN